MNIDMNRPKNPKLRQVSDGTIDSVQTFAFAATSKDIEVLGKHEQSKRLDKATHVNIYISQIAYDESKRRGFASDLGVATGYDCKTKDLWQAKGRSFINDIEFLLASNSMEYIYFKQYQPRLVEIATYISACQWIASEVIQRYPSARFIKQPRHWMPFVPVGHPPFNKPDSSAILTLVCNSKTWRASVIFSLLAIFKAFKSYSLAISNIPRMRLRLALRQAIRVFVDLSKSALWHSSLSNSNTIPENFGASCHQARSESANKKILIYRDDDIKRTFNLDVLGEYFKAKQHIDSYNGIGMFIDAYAQYSRKKISPWSHA